ncbi:nuclear transport factor 2 family protein [Flagellimonas sp. S3867]|uniref:nuclear transport factor 2 family protein n=1 Tax=Flagellimonas sp. S3867 TaxID=2768063 RepID=UPI001685EED3|nr:nuclear transport factor 2 family protein [Flagellimonas sp. S3867]
MNPRFLIAFLLTTSTYGQVNTDVYLFDLSLEQGNPVLTNPKNISNNEGYDNQPSFLDNNTVLFSSTRADQTDIRRFNIEAGSTSSWISNTPTGSEYSPLKIPGRNAVSAIRLDLNGLQLLYEYNLITGEPVPILDELKVAYHLWYNDHILISSVLVGNRLDLVMSNLEDGTNRTLRKNVGRSLSKIPNSNLISYISKTEQPWQIKSLDPNSGITNYIANVPEESEDICWLNATTILSGIGKSLMKLNTENEEEWSTVMLFQQEEINNISRIAVNENRTRLAFVAEESIFRLIDRQVSTFNNRDLLGFVSCYSENVLVQRFPNETMYQGRQKMTENYDRFYQNTKDAKVEVVNRIQIGNTVIDEEISRVDGRKGHQVAIYEVKNGFIDSMRFIFPDRETNDSESVVQTQLDAYNARDIDAFMATFSDDIELLNFPNKLAQKGTLKMKASYEEFFESTPDLHCEIKNRIVIGNKVIDEEFVTANGSSFGAVAIYEVENGKIAKVTFLR